MPLQQETRDLGTIKEKVVRPFQRKTRCADPCHSFDRLMQGEPGDEAELRGGGHLARINQKKAGIEVAGRRRPLPAVPPPARKLLAGGDPELPWITGTRSLKGIIVRRARRLEREKPIAGGLGRQLHGQNKERAAAPAALTIGAGTSQNSSTMALDTKRTKLTPGDMRSNRSTGASKYMTFTTRR